MAYGTTAAGTITKEQTLHSIRRLPLAASTTITKGNVCELNANGELIVSPTSQTDNSAHFVALETVDNSSGSANDLYCPVAVKGHFVTVIADGEIEAGEQVVVSGSTAGQVVASNPATQDKSLVVGIYWGKEGGTYAKAGTTPFAESLSDGENFSPALAADGDVIEIELV